LADKSEDLKRNPSEFFRVFKPFLKDKVVRRDQDIELNINGDIVKDQVKVSERLANHFADIADRTGETNADL